MAAALPAAVAVTTATALLAALPAAVPATAVHRAAAHLPAAVVAVRPALQGLAPALREGANRSLTFPYKGFEAHITVTLPFGNHRHSTSLGRWLAC